MADSSQLPEGFDADSLARMANEFFSALPGESFAGLSLPLSSSPLNATAQNSAVAAPANPPGPATPADASGLAARAPALAPHSSTATGVPDNAATAAPAVNNRPGGAALGVPEAYAAALPAVPDISGPVSIPSTPYYFLGESSAYSSPLTDESATGSLDALAAQSYSLPGTAGLDTLLKQISVTGPGDTGLISEGNAVPKIVHTPEFYFLDQSLPQTGNVNIADSGRIPFDVHSIRKDFPILSERVNGRPLVWFDNAATTQKPQAVIDRLAYFYAHENSNIHRAAHELATRATDAYEAARSKVARFLGAASAEEIIFVRGATEAINLVAKSWGVKHINEGDEIIVSHLEHHANIVPWQQLAAEKGARLRVIPVDDSGQVKLDEYQKLLNDRTKLVAVSQVSNALGTVVPVQQIVQAAHRVGACVLIDGAQAVSHMRVNVQTLDADFYVFSGHKIFGPTGIGVVYGKREVLEATPPWQGGGNMIKDVTFEHTVYQEPPTRFEAGTGNIADAVGLGAAIDYVERIGLENIARYEHALLEYATHGLKTVPGLRLIGTAKDKASVVSFVLDGHTSEDVGKALNQEGIAVRSGHHCAQPILRRFGQETTVRPSLAFYNTCEEVDRLVSVLRKLASK